MVDELKRHLCDEDIVDIKFVDYELRWLTPDDFIKDAKLIKRVYNEKMNYNQRHIYKWFCYANIHTTMYQKNKIWDYLNGDIGYSDIVYALKHKGFNYKEKL